MNVVCWAINQPHKSSIVTAAPSWHSILRGAALEKRRGMTARYVVVEYGRKENVGNKVDQAF